MLLALSEDVLWSLHVAPQSHADWTALFHPEAAGEDLFKVGIPLAEGK